MSNSIYLQIIDHLAADAENRVVITGAPNALGDDIILTPAMAHRVTHCDATHVFYTGPKDRHCFHADQVRFSQARRN